MTDASTEAALRDMNRSIGGLESTVKNLMTMWQQQEQAATQGRRDLHQKFDVVVKDVSGLTVKLDAAVKDISEIKPSVRAFENAKEQAKGAQTLGRWIWGLLVFIGGCAGWAISSWISIAPKPPLH
jgi:uncharacterized protein YoxC